MKRFVLTLGAGLVMTWLTLAAPSESTAALATSSRDLPTAPELPSRSAGDWLVAPWPRRAGVYRGSSDRELALDNGLIRRSFRLQPNVATVAFDNLMTGASLLRAVQPEAQVSINGQTYNIGGLVGQPEQAYLLPEWLDDMKAAPGSFQAIGFQIGPTEAPFGWKRKRHSADLPWPAPGVALHVQYRAPDALQGVTISVHYELYDGLPVVGKWLTLINGTDHSLMLHSFTSEILATAEVESAVDERPFRNWRLPLLDVMSEYAFHGMDATTASQTTTWLPDPQYTSQVNYELKMPAKLVSRPPLGPDLQIAPGQSFDSFRTYVVIHDSDSRERQGLSLRRAQRALAPWSTENPIMMHVRSANSKIFRNAVDQCAQVGFEMIIYTFGSGLDMENVSPEYLARIKSDVDYAHSQGIEVGAYSLLASRRVSDQDDVINPVTGKPGGAIFGNSPCLGSHWGNEYFRKIRHFIEATGLDLLEHDGSYPGDVCASTEHPGHKGLKDSQWTQWRTISDFYKWCRARGTYLNVPDYYFLAGSSKTGMGYRESNWSLPRERQIILGRQNIYDGTWTKSPSMGWMFVPLVEYQGGGAAATLEPLHEHLDGYEAHLVNNFGAGVQACYRGPRLYDTDATRAVVEKWVAWFKQHRDILESDIIHVRRPDGRDLDCFLHVNPLLQQRAMAVIYNPLQQEVSRSFTLPLSYAGLSQSVLVRERDGEPRSYPLDRQNNASVPVKVPARGMTWLILEKPE
jgi:hypothetical protein